MKQSNQNQLLDEVRESQAFADSSRVFHRITSHTLELAAPQEASANPYRVPIEFDDTLLGYLQARATKNGESKEDLSKDMDLLRLEADYLACTAVNKLGAVIGVPGRSPAVLRACQIVNERFEDENLTLLKVAAETDVSAKHLSEIFKRETGQRFTDFLARVRVENAKRLLRDYTRRVSEVAYASGFRSISQFNRTFRKITGNSPSHFRKALAAKGRPENKA